MGDAGNSRRSSIRDSALLASLMLGESPPGPAQLAPLSRVTFECTFNTLMALWWSGLADRAALG